MDADRPVVQAREPLRGRAYCHRLVRGRLTQTSRTGPGAAGPGPPAQPPAPRRGRGPSGRRTSCARSPARRRTWSPPHAERHRATGRWQGEHGGQQAHSYSPAKHNRSVTTTTARTVTDVLTQNCHRSPEASQLRRMGERYVHATKVRSRRQPRLTSGALRPARSALRRNHSSASWSPGPLPARSPDRSHSAPRSIQLRFDDSGGRCLPSRRAGRAGCAARSQGRRTALPGTAGAGARCCTFACALR